MPLIFTDFLHDMCWRPIACLKIMEYQTHPTVYGKNSNKVQIFELYTTLLHHRLHLIQDSFVCIFGAFNHVMHIFAFAYFYFKYTQTCWLSHIANLSSEIEFPFPPSTRYILKRLMPTAGATGELFLEKFICSHQDVHACLPLAILRTRE